MYVHTYGCSTFTHLSNVPYRSLLRNITNTSFCNSTSVWIQACLLSISGVQPRMLTLLFLLLLLAHYTWYPNSFPVTYKRFNSIARGVLQCSTQGHDSLPLLDTLSHCQSYFAGTAVRCCRHTITCLPPDWLLVSTYHIMDCRWTMRYLHCCGLI